MKEEVADKRESVTGELTGRCFYSYCLVTALVERGRERGRERGIERVIKKGKGKIRSRSIRDGSKGKEVEARVVGRVDVLEIVVSN